MFIVLYAAILLIFLLSHLLRGLAVDHLVVVDPATNHVGWLCWSLLIAALRWQWWTALLLRLRPTGVRWHRWLFFGLLCLVDAYISYTPRYSWLIYGGDISSHAHLIMMVLHTLLSIGENASLLLLAFVVSRTAYLLPVMVFLSALKIFIIDLPTPAEPFLREIFASGLPVVGYLVLATAVIRFTAGPSTEVGRSGDPPSPGSSRRSSGATFTASSG